MAKKSNLITQFDMSDIDTSGQLEEEVYAEEMGKTPAEGQKSTEKEGFKGKNDKLPVSGSKPAKKDDLTENRPAVKKEPKKAKENPEKEGKSTAAFAKEYKAKKAAENKKKAHSERATITLTPAIKDALAKVRKDDPDFNLSDLIIAFLNDYLDIK